MSMQIGNDTQRNKALNAYNQNKTQAEKNFERISNGMKIIHAGDNSSAWAISERMREMIRSFSQDDQNVQNGSALVKTAERSIDQIVQNLRTLKELALDSANDSNTDEDRRVIQKEFEQIRATIDEIAFGTNYNGKFLLNGRYLAPEPDIGNTTVDGIVESITEGDNAVSDGQDHNGSSYDPRWLFEVQQSFNGESAGPFSVVLDFSGMEAAKDYPHTLNRQGFAILCGACNQFINIIFDSTKSASESTYGKPPAPGNPNAKEFVIGVRDVKGPEDLPQAIFKGILVHSSKIPSRSGYEPSTPTNTLLDTNHELRIKLADDGTVTIQKRDHLSLQFRNRPIKLGVEGNPLWIQHGTRAGQRFQIYVNPMDSATLGISEVDVKTRDNALLSIGAIDSAIEYAINEATTMGAYLQRMEATKTSITTMNENIQAAESVLRDADMAKEMTDYVRYNILTQSSQAMVSQAGKNDEAVLGLIR